MSTQRGRCEICQKDKILKFCSSRLSICDLCLKKVSGAEFDLCTIKELIRKIVDETFPLYAKYSAEVEARKIFYTSKNLFSKFISNFYESNKSTIEIKNLALKIYEERNSTILNKRNFWNKSFLENPDINKFKMTSDELNQIYIYKAFLKGLLNQNGQLSNRLSPEEMYVIRNEIIKNDGLVCAKCHKSENIEYHLHHIIPLNKYGTNKASNLILLCRSCHQKQHRGFKISKNFTPNKKNKIGKLHITCPWCKYKFIENSSSQWTVCPMCNYEINIKK